MSGFSRGRPEQIDPDAITPMEFAVMMVHLSEITDIPEFMRQSITLMTTTLESAGYKDGIDLFVETIKRLNNKCKSPS